MAGGLSLLSPHLALLSHLGGLDLHLCCLTHTDLQALSECVCEREREREVACLKLMRTFECECVLSPVQALPSLTELTELDLSSNKEVGGVVSDLVSALPLSQIKLLPLNGCSLNQESLSALGTPLLLAASYSSLVYFKMRLLFDCLNTNQIFCMCVPALAMPYLWCIDVSWSKMVGGHLALLLEALQPSVTQELRLSSCDLTTDDLLHLGTRMHTHTITHSIHTY